MFRATLILCLLYTLADAQTTTTAVPENSSSIPRPRDPADSENCIVLCLTTVNILIFGIVVSLILCICAVICQQQPREIFYLVDRLPEGGGPVPAHRPPYEPAILPAQPASKTTNTNVGPGKSPTDADESSPSSLQHRADSAPSTDEASGVKKSVKIDITSGQTRYAAQESNEDEPMPQPSTQPIPLPLQEKQVMDGMPVADPNIPIVISK